MTHTHSHSGCLTRGSSVCAYKRFLLSVCVRAGVACWRRSRQIDWQLFPEGTMVTDVQERGREGETYAGPFKSETHVSSSRPRLKANRGWSGCEDKTRGQLPVTSNRLWRRRHLEGDHHQLIHGFSSPEQELLFNSDLVSLKKPEQEPWAEPTWAHMERLICLRPTD